MITNFCYRQLSLFDGVEFYFIYNKYLKDARKIMGKGGKKSREEDEEAF